MIRKIKFTQTPFVAFFILFNNTSALSQAEWQNRNSIAVRASVTNKLELQLNYMWAYEMSNKFQPTFRQTGLQASYELTKRTDISGGAQFLTSPGSTETRTRIFIRAAHTTRVADVLTWTNAVRLETNSKVETRFRNRIGISTRIGLRKRMDFLNLSPSVSGIIFYNIGGNPIRYYNKDEQLIARQTPDGFHRGRITFNLNSRINKYLQLNLFYMRQQEFNFLTTDTRKMNVYDPVRNRTLRPFNNFNSIGLGARINLDPLFKGD